MHITDLRLDSQQLNTWHKLDQVYPFLQSALSPSRWWKLPFISPKINGVYLWGGVGRGKTWIMTQFMLRLPSQRAKKVHFLVFMRHINRLLALYKDEPTPLTAVAKHLSKDFDILFLDEFQVTNIADAMLLPRLFKEIFSLGLVCLFTSNQSPEKLYEDGLLRERLQPFIKFLNERCVVIELEGSHDYRRFNHQSNHGLWIHPLNDSTFQKLNLHYLQTIDNSTEASYTLVIDKREWVLKKTMLNQNILVVWLEFAEICAENRSASDFVALATTFRKIYIHNIPKMDDDLQNEALRFVHLIDIIYDNGCQVYAQADCSINQIYIGNKHQESFKRTVSRLFEMTSSSASESTN